MDEPFLCVREVVHVNAVMREHQRSSFALSDRHEFMATLRQCCANARRHDEKIAVLSIDLGRFKHIKAAYGHHFGAMIVRCVGQQLGSRLHEPLALGHLGGDNFAVVVPVDDADDAASVANGVLRLLEAPLRLDDGTSIRMYSTIGVALFPDHGFDAETVLSRADVAVCHSRSSDTSGECKVHSYTSAIGHDARNRQRLLVELHRAIDEREFYLAYQPKIALATGGYAGAEVLVRWNNPSLGNVSPGEFIPVAEDVGLICQIGDWVLGEAIRTLGQVENSPSACGRLAVNVSAVQLGDDGFVARLERMLLDAGVRGSQLELEVTESALMSSIGVVAQRLASLQELGVSITLDDFGTGYSTFSHLRDLPIQTIKIAPSFVGDINEEVGSGRLVAAMVAMARSLDLRIVAEGVETRRQATFLESLGCHYGQGYLFAKPMGAVEFERWLTQGRDRRPDAIGPAKG